MIDDTTPSNLSRHSAGRAQSLADVLLPSQFTLPRFGALFDPSSAIRGFPEALRSQFAAPRFDALSATRGLGDALRSQFAAPRFKPALIDIKSATHSIAEMLQGVERSVAHFSEGVERSLALFSDVATLMKQADQLTEAGWIPHPALPIKALVGSETNPTQISARVKFYVDDNIEQLYAVLTNRFTTYNITEDTLALCNAVIRAHRLELFPLIVPAVFAEIERCARNALGSSTKQHGKKIIDNFVARINDLPASAFNIVQFPTLVLMEDFIYESISLDTEVSFPHRHASQHGIIRFNTPRDCLNAIFLLDFVLQSSDALQKLPSQT
jgi:hypothetical protein